MMGRKANTPLLFQPEGRILNRPALYWEVWYQLTPTERMVARRLFGAPRPNQIHQEFRFYADGHYRDRRYWYDLTARVVYRMEYCEFKVSKN